eukprot:5792930-Karenia_brevis.AAC.1
MKTGELRSAVGKGSHTRFLAHRLVDTEQVGDVLPNDGNCSHSAVSGANETSCMPKSAGA